MSKPVAQLELAFTKVVEKKNLQSSLKVDLRKILEEDPEYQKITEQMKTLDQQRKAVLTRVERAYPKIVAELEVLAADLKAEREFVTDVAVARLAEGKEVSFTDQAGIEWEPIWSVRFRKVDSARVEEEA